MIKAAQILAGLIAVGAVLTLGMVVLGLVVSFATGH
jgi:hypothetical protein